MAAAFLRHCRGTVRHRSRQLVWHGELPPQHLERSFQLRTGRGARHHRGHVRVGTPHQQRSRARNGSARDRSHARRAAHSVRDSRSNGAASTVQSNYQNDFFDGGNSFPSNHAAVAFAFASVVAREYPNLYAQLGAYGLATGISLARVAASQHFLSDAFIGALIGYQTGRQIYKTRHDSRIDDDLTIVAKQTSAPLPRRLASTYVPLDSWIYPAIERLAIARYIPDAVHGPASLDAHELRADAGGAQRATAIQRRASCRDECDPPRAQSGVC